MPVGKDCSSVTPSGSGSGWRLVARCSPGGRVRNPGVRIAAVIDGDQSPLDDQAYKHRDDLLDAALCAWTAALWHRQGVKHCQVLGDEPGLAGEHRLIQCLRAPAHIIGSVKCPHDLFDVERHPPSHRLRTTRVDRRSPSDPTPGRSRRLFSWVNGASSNTLTGQPSSRRFLLYTGLSVCTSASRRGLRMNSRPSRPIALGSLGSGGLDLSMFHATHRHSCRLLLSAREIVSCATGDPSTRTASSARCRWLNGRPDKARVVTGPLVGRTVRNPCQHRSLLVSKGLACRERPGAPTSQPACAK